MMITRFASQLLPHALALLLLLPACSWRDPMLPVSIRDQRSRTTTAAFVDLYAVRGEMEQRRQTITPVDEYFATLGRSSRPQDIRRIILDAATRGATIFPDQDATGRLWQEKGADILIAVTPKPERRSTSAADPRRVTCPLHRSAYPAGTQSLLIMLTDGGLVVRPSAERLRPPPLPSAPSS